MINILIFQIVIYNIVVLIVGINRKKWKGVVDYRYLISVLSIVPQ